MFRLAAIFAVIFCAHQASAEECPGFFRFVDFGIEGHDGETYRGGPVFRAEGFDGQALLRRSQTKCLSVRETSIDGRGNSIPVVTGIEYNPDKIKISLTDLSVTIVGDAEVMAEKNVGHHRAALEQANTNRLEGPNSLCAKTEQPSAISCQVVSPYQSNFAVVAYCNARQCRVPVLAMSGRLVVSAAWESDQSFLDAPEAAGAAISAKVQEISDLMDTLSSEVHLR